MLKCLNIQSPLARRLILATIVISSVITLLITAVHLYSDYRQGVNRINRDIGQVKTTYLQSLTESLWVFDETQTVKHLQGLVSIPNIEYVNIRVNGQIKWDMGEQASRRYISESIPLLISYNNKKINVGVLTLFASLDEIYNELLDDVLFMLLTNAFKTFVVAVFMLFLVHYFITRHIYQLVEHAEQQALEKPFTPFSLNKKKQNKPDELDKLAMAINNMYERLRKSHQDYIQSEQHVRLLLESTVEAIYGVDLDGYCTFANPACVSIIGFENESDMIGECMHELIHHSEQSQESSTLEQCVICESIQRANAGRGDKTVLWRQDGTSFPAEYWTGPIINDNNVIGTVVTFYDITERVRTENELEQHRYHLEDIITERTAQLNEAKEIAVQASQAKSEFLSRMNHELRTPLNAILGFTQVLDMDESLGKEQKDHLNEIESAGQHLLLLVEELLDLASIESGRIDLKLESVSILQVALDSIAVVRMSAQKRRIRIINDIDKDIYVIADPLRIKEVLLNLLTNGVKYNNEGGNITLAYTNPVQGWVRLEVTDTGPGLSSEQQQLIFEPFIRLGDESGEIEGTGIGLTITRQLVELMSGKIGVKSKPGQGCCFYVELPVYEV